MGIIGKKFMGYDYRQETDGYTETQETLPELIRKLL
jgi:hypothetical protein